MRLKLHPMFCYLTVTLSLMSLSADQRRFHSCCEHIRRVRTETGLVSARKVAAAATKPQGKQREV